MEETHDFNGQLLPDDGRFRQLQHDDEADGHHQEGQVDEHHEAADAFRVRTKLESNQFLFLAANV